MQKPMYALLALIVSALAQPSLALAKNEPPISLPKTSKWEMRYDEDSCKLLATFGQDHDKIVLLISRERPSDYFGVELYGKPLAASGQIPMEVGFGSAPPMKRDGIAMTMSGGERLAVIKIDGLRIDGWSGGKEPQNAPEITPAAESAVTSISFTKDGKQSYVLRTGSMAEPLAALRACTSDLLKYWGFDPALEASLTRGPTPTGNPRNWAQPSDYPTSALFGGHSGLVQFRLDVGTDGLPYGCRILYRTNPDEFADLSCQLLMRRARFTPALDAHGKPIKWFYMNRILWISGGSGW